MQAVALHINSISFDRRKGVYTLALEGKTYQQRVCEFLYTFSFLSKQNPEEYLLSTEEKYDSVRIPLSSLGKSVTLPLTSFLGVRNIYQEEMFRLKLEDTLFRNGISLPSAV